MENFNLKGQLLTLTDLEVKNSKIKNYWKEQSSVKKDYKRNYD
jgi:hypothetical protein